VEIALSVILIIVSLVMILLVLLHKGKGGGLSDLFGYGALFAVMCVVSAACLGLALFVWKPEPLVAPGP